MWGKFLSFVFHANTLFIAICLEKQSLFESKVFLLPHMSSSQASLEFWNLSSLNISFLFCEEKTKLRNFVLSISWVLLLSIAKRCIFQEIATESNILSPLCHPPPIQHSAENCQFAAKISPFVQNKVLSFVTLNLQYFGMKPLIWMCFLHFWLKSLMVSCYLKMWRVYGWHFEAKNYFRVAVLII